MTSVSESDDDNAYLCSRVTVPVIFYWYLLCSRKANFYVIHRQ